MTLAQLKRLHGILQPESAAWVDYDGPVQRGPVVGGAKYRIGDGSVLMLAGSVLVREPRLASRLAECSDVA